MAHYYGVVEGTARTQAARVGHKTQGLTTIAKTWTHGIKTMLYWNDEEEQDYCWIMLTNKHDKNITLYKGPLANLEEQSKIPQI